LLTIIKIGFFEVLLVIIGFPIAIFEIFLGTYVDEFIYAVIFDYVFKSIGIIIAFIISRYILKKFIFEQLKKYEFFMVFDKIVK
jgi:predicted membrane protein